MVCEDAMNLSFWYRAGLSDCLNWDGWERTQNSLKKITDEAMAFLFASRHIRWLYQSIAEQHIAINAYSLRKRKIISKLDTGNNDLTYRNRDSTTSTKMISYQSR